eukprot:7629103-Karenia_brevis.AAC.1
MCIRDRFTNVEKVVDEPEDSAEQPSNHAKRAGDEAADEGKTKKPKCAGPAPADKVNTAKKLFGNMNDV